MKKYILSIIISICVFATATAQVNTNPFMKVEGMPAMDGSSDTLKLATYQLSNMQIRGAKVFYDVIRSMDEFSLEAIDTQALEDLKKFIRGNMGGRISATPLAITVSYKVMAAYDEYTRNFTDEEIAKKEQELAILKEQTASANRFRGQANDLEKAKFINPRNSALSAKRNRY